MEIYAQLEYDIITDMAGRLSKLGKVTEATTHQAAIFNQIGGLQQDIRKSLNKYDTQAQKQLETLFTEAIEKSVKSDLTVFNAAKRSMSEGQKQILKATAEKVQSADIITGSKKVQRDAQNGFTKAFTGLQRLTMTIAETASYDFVSEANAAYMKVVSGAFDYKTALKQSVNALAEKGVRTVEYTDSGTRRTHTIEGAVRSNILTGINQTTQQITLDNCEELECDLVEVSAHMGSRPSHAEWQGKIYSLSGESKKYPSFYEVCRPGTPDGICGINCRHSYYPYFEGMPSHYTKDELDEMKEPSVKYNGKDITQYEAEQKLRACERNIRKYKLKSGAFEAAGEDATAAKKLTGEWQAAARDLVEQTGIRRDYSREYAGMETGKQPRGIKPGSLETNAAKKAAELFPAEKWEKKSESIYVAESRLSTVKAEKEKYKKEYAQAAILSKYGHTTYLVPEAGAGKHYDAIVDGIKTEFKTVTGNLDRVGRRFNEGLEQGNDIFIRIAQRFTEKEIYSKLIGEIKSFKGKTNGRYVYIWVDEEKKLHKWDIDRINKIAKTI